MDSGMLHSLRLECPPATTRCFSETGLKLRGDDLLTQVVARPSAVIGDGLQLLLHVVRTNGTLGYRLVIVYGSLGIDCSRYVLPRYDLNELARAVALAHGLRCCSSMSG